MLKKSVIDANKELIRLWRNNLIIDYEMLDRGSESKLKLPGIISSNNATFKTKISAYRPEGARPGTRGDPRFWPYGLSKVANEGDKLIIFVNEKTSILIVTDPEKLLDPHTTIQQVSGFLD